MLNLDGTFTYIPDAEAVGHDEFIVEVSDGQQSAESIVHITVDKSTAVHEIEEGAVTISPNPTNGHMRIDLPE
jgi:hypothetical protein